MKIYSKWSPKIGPELKISRNLGSSKFSSRTGFFQRFKTEWLLSAKQTYKSLDMQAISKHQKITKNNQEKHTKFIQAFRRTLSFFQTVSGAMFLMIFEDFTWS